MRILAEDTMALIIDYQDKLMPVINQQEVLCEKSKILIKGLNTLGIPMIVSQQYTKGIGMTVASIIESIGDTFSYYDKVTFSCADDEEIMKVIVQERKKNIIICGVEAHICVLQTVIDLIEKGYHVVLVENCIGSRQESDRLMAIERARQEGATITTYESILFELTRSAKHEKFKVISSLIK